MDPREEAAARALAAQAWGVYLRAWAAADTEGRTAQSAAQLRRFAGERAVRAYATTQAAGGAYTEAQYQLAFAEIRNAQRAAREVDQRASSRAHPADYGGRSLNPFVGQGSAQYAYVIGYTVRLPGRRGRAVGGHVTIYSGTPLSLDRVLAAGRHEAYEAAMERYGDYPGTRDRGELPIPDVTLRAVWQRP